MKKILILFLLFISASAMAQQNIQNTIKNAENGDFKAQYNLALAYHNGSQGLPKDTQKTIYWAEKSANQGCGQACNLLGIIYIRGEGTEKDLTMAEKWLKKGVEKNDTYCKYTLGQLYVSNEMKRYENGLKLLIPLAENGDMYAMNDIGLAYNDLGQNDKALEWLLKARYKGNETAILNLGNLYLKGINGFPIDYDKAASFYRLASESKDTYKAKIAKHNLPIAYFKLGDMLLHQKEFDDAVIYLMRAASNEDNPIPEAMRKLSACFRYGYGVEKDKTKEEYYLEEAAKFNDEIAMKILGL